MAIRKRPAGMAITYAKLGKLAGEVRQAGREAEIRQRTESALLTEQRRRELSELEHQWSIEAFNRSKAWEIEKMEMSSRLDFQRQEKARQETLGEFDIAIKAIDREVQSGRITPDQANKFKLMAETRMRIGWTPPVSVLFPQQEDVLGQLISQAITGKTPTSSTTPTTNRIHVVSPSGQTGTILASEWNQYAAQGFKRTQ
jgi:hypothetical protein